MNAEATTGDAPTESPAETVVAKTDGAGLSEVAADRAAAAAEDASHVAVDGAADDASHVAVDGAAEDASHVADDGVAEDGVAEDGVAEDGVADDGVAEDGVAAAEDATHVADDGVAAAEGATYVARQSRHERKARKALSKLGLTPIPGVKRVVIRKTDDSMYVITNAEVFKNPKSDSYIVFGDWQVQDLNRQVQSDAARMFQLPAHPQSTQIMRPIMLTPMMYNEIYGEIDYSGVDENDVELICEQLQVDKSTAIDSLRKNNNDIVNAIMDLTQP